ncbi:AAA family ATPase [Olleya aquimaris]|uniref:Putative ATP-dependent endonuclease of OLD family n=1 Tax=Olleya aquimaris TaxID=639310 RepID=A0A327RK46_9FLAO|nr:AAA family ATPase [Olleya aquimaris]RAJ16372.1 putative ATP-dependent endonuclease of OLD family [Olleya aquimaris]
MKLKNIAITNYRGVKNKQEVPLRSLSSVVGKNDAGKSIVLNAIATFLDAKNYSVVDSDFNDIDSSIVFQVVFEHSNLKEILEAKIKSKIKKADGLEEFLNDFIFDGTIIYEREISKSGKVYTKESILIKDFDDEEFANLYFKTDEELNKIIADNTIVIPVEGKGRNSKIEKIKHIKEFAITKGVQIEGKFIVDSFKINSLFPQVELFVSDYGLEADTKFKTNSVTEISDYFNRETQDETQRLRVIENEIEAEMQNEADSIKSFMSDYTSSLQKVEIKPQITWKDAIKNVDVRFQFDGDANPIPMSHKGTGYRRLFMVARFRYLAEKNKGNNIVYLIEEPETFLHPSAQEDLLNALKELSEENQIVITTHSPVFAGATNPESVILCKKDGQTVYEYATEATKEDFVFKIIDELGIKPSFNLRDSFEKILFVEGKDDAIAYKLICQKLFDKDLEENVLVLPTGGSSVDSFINISYFKKNGRELFLLLDSDKGLSIRNPKKPLIQAQSIVNFNSNFGTGYALHKSNLESYYHPRVLEDFYFRLKPYEIHFFGEDEDLQEFFKEKGIKKKDNINIFNSMTKEQFEEVLEQELIDFLEKIIS